MRVLSINTTFKNGGSTGRIVSDLNQIMLQNEIDSYVAYGINDGIPDTQHIRCVQSSFELKKSQVQSRLFARHGFYNVAATKRLLTFIDSINPDVIHLHNIHGYYVHCGMLFDYIKLHDIPVVWTLHDCWAFTGWCAYFDYANCDRWKTHCYHCPNIKEYPKAWITSRASSNYDLKMRTFCGVKNLTLVTPSKWLANLTRESFLKDYQVKVINNGVDISIFKPVENKVKKELHIEGKKMILAVAGGLAKRKGSEYLIKIPSQLNEDEVLVILGIRENQKKLLPSQKCIGIPYSNSLEKLAMIYSAADVFINTTLEDNFPTTNIEALACGIPVVTFDTGGSIEAVLDNEHYVDLKNGKKSSVGGVVPKGDVETMLCLVREITSQDKKKYSENCIRKAHEYYNRESQLMDYIKLYKEISKKK